MSCALGLCRDMQSTREGIPGLKTLNASSVTVPSIHKETAKLSEKRTHPNEQIITLWETLKDEEKFDCSKALRLVRALLSTDWTFPFLVTLSLTPPCPPNSRSTGFTLLQTTTRSLSFLSTPPPLLELLPVLASYIFTHL